MENEIGHIFRRYNVIEYKSPWDELSIDDYYKTVGYACLYKGLGMVVNAVPIDELTVTIIRETYPKELFKMLRGLGVEIEEHYPGIYYAHGRWVMLDSQIIVTKQLDKKTHRALRVLSASAKEEDVRAFVEEASHLDEPGDRNNVNAVLQVSVSANRHLYEAIRKGDEVMCEALRELMKDEIEESERRGRQEGRQESSIEMIKNLMDSMKWTAEQAMAALKIPNEDKGRYMTKL